MNLLDRHYYVKNKYTMGSYLYFKEKVGISASDRTITFEMFSKLTRFLPNDMFEIGSNASDKMTLFILFDSKIKQDGYVLDINTKQEIIIHASSERGVRYALAFACSLVEKTDTGYRLPIVFVEDEPSFLYRGLIEGYYGTPWSYEERLEMFDYFTKMRLNTYLYAPKMDIYHRDKWYLMYPEEELRQLETLVGISKEHLIDFYYCIAPGHKTNEEAGFRYIDDTDYQRLFAKLDQLLEIGVTDFGLLLDDIDYQLDAQHKAKFMRPGIAHAEICNRVYHYLQSKVKDTRFVMCPTEYHQIGESMYRNDLKEHLDPAILVFWTGDNVCAEVITTQDIATTKEAFGHDLWIWDNFPVSDFTYGVREYIAPIQNRSCELSEYASGYIINPSIHYHISKVGMTTMSHYAWNSAKYDPQTSFWIALTDISEEFYRVGKDYIRFNYPSVLDYGDTFTYQTWVKEENTKEIFDLYEKVTKSAKSLLGLSLPIIEELSPWLTRVIEEEKIVKEIIAGSIQKQDLLRFLEDIHFSGATLLDEIILAFGVLNEEEYQQYITKRRGYPWYRVFEYKRWPKK